MPPTRLVGLLWLVGVRWLAVGVLLAASVALGSAIGLAVAVALTLWNGGLHVALRRSGPVLRRNDALVAAQVAIDLVALTLVLHGTGGVTSPLAMLYVLPLAVAGTLLPLGWMLAVAGLALVLYAGGVALELSSSHPGPAGARVAVFLLMEVGLLWLLRGLVRRFVEADALRAQRERIARSRERLARIGSLSAGVAHGIRSPLHGLSQGVAVFEARCPGCGPQSDTLLREMRRAIDHLERITRRLLRPSVPGARPESIDLGEALEGVTRLVRARAERRDVELCATLAGPMGLCADRGDLDEVLVNVLDNAIDASPPGEVVAIDARTTPSGWTAIEVRDRGPGMLPEVLERAFDPFFTTKPIGLGTGIGLPITRRIVESAGGRVELESAPGQGTRIRLIFPPDGPRSADPEAQASSLRSNSWTTAR